MKNRLSIPVLLSAIIVFSCEKTAYKSTGTITESDYRKCMCCGGYLLEIDGKQFNFEKSELPDNFTFDDTLLPLQIELNFEPKADDCSGSGINWITILKIRKLE